MKIDTTTQTPVTEVGGSPVPTAAPLRTILVAVDGSIGAEKAMAWAVDAAGSTARLVLVHVLTYSKELLRDASLDTITNWRRELRRQLHDDWAAPAIAAGRPVTSELAEADSAAAGILAAADRAGADLIVLGAHGRGSLSDRLLGATTYKVSHGARIPVVIIPIDWSLAA